MLVTSKRKAKTTKEVIDASIEVLTTLTDAQYRSREKNERRKFPDGKRSDSLSHTSSLVSQQLGIFAELWM